MRRIFVFVLAVAVLLCPGIAHGAEPLDLDPTVVVGRSLRIGCKGEDVWWLQYTLTNLGYDVGKSGCDGVYGKQTKQAVSELQEDVNLKPTGIVDKATLRIVKELSEVETTDPAVSRGDITDREFELMCMVVWKEARGEPFEGKVAVAEVILNRVRSMHFPNTISGVVLQPAAFTGFTGSNKYDEESVSAVELAFTGTNYSNGADHFCDLNMCNPSWAKDEYFVTRIGDHWFYNLHIEEGE